jgi:hypothetical protein
VIANGQTFGTGEAETEFEARTAGNETVRRIEATPPEGRY